MSRMLEALKQIEARSVQSAEAPGPSLTLLPAPVAEAESIADPPAIPSAQSPSVEMPVPVATAAAAAEATLQEIEAAVAMAVEPYPEPRSARSIAERGPYHELAGNILSQLSPIRPAVLMFTSPLDGDGKNGDCGRLGWPSRSRSATSIDR